MVPADLCEGADEGELGHVGGGAVAVVVVVPPFAALVLVPAKTYIHINISPNKPSPAM